MYRVARFERGNVERERGKEVNKNLKKALKNQLIDEGGLQKRVNFAMCR